METEFTAAAGQQQLMVWVLENQGWGGLAKNLAGLRLQQAGN
jgi:hypothetical protein